MTETATISAKSRDRAGKGAARAVRREGLVPAVIYGEGQDPVMLAIDPRDVWKGLRTGHFFSTVYNVEIEGAKKVERVLPRDVQFHPVSDAPEHVDFLRVGPSTRVAVHVPVVFENEAASPGLKRGGVLNIVRHDIELLVRVDHIPDEIHIDVTGYDIGQAIKISMVKLPDDVTPTITDRDFTIATIAPPKTGLIEEASEDEAEEA